MTNSRTNTATGNAGTADTNYVEIDLGFLPTDTKRKLYAICEKRNLPWPEGIISLIDEACKPMESELLGC